MNVNTGGNIARRYPVSFALKYVAAASEARSGTGETVWMSGSEVAFLSKGQTDVGSKVTLNIEWPVLLQGEVPLQLTTVAEIVQRSGPLCVARMTKYEFRTRGNQSSPLSALHWPPVLLWEPPPARQMSAGKAFGAPLRRPAAAAWAAGG